MGLHGLLQGCMAVRIANYCDVGICISKECGIMDVTTVVNKTDKKLNLHINWLSFWMSVDE
jgi:hypothetical protein